MPHSKEDDGDQLRENLALQEPFFLVDVSQHPIVCRAVEIGYHVLQTTTINNNNDTDCTSHNWKWTTQILPNNKKQK